MSHFLYKNYGKLKTKTQYLQWQMMVETGSKLKHTMYNPCNNIYCEKKIHFYIQRKRTQWE